MTFPGIDPVGIDPVPTQLLFFAVPEEAGPFLREWRRIHPGSVQKRPGPGPASWDLVGAVGIGVRVHVTGMGPGNAARIGAAAMESCPGARAVLTAGFAGGLDPALRCGDVLMDSDDGFPMASVLASGGARTGRFHESDRVAVTADEKAILRRKTGADAVEMESATLRNLARQRGLSGATVRVISDEAEETLPLDFNALMTPDDRLDFCRLAWHLVRSPRTIPRLLRFQKRVRHAADSLAMVLVRALDAEATGEGRRLRAEG